MISSEFQFAYTVFMIPCFLFIGSSQELALSDHSVPEWRVHSARSVRWIEAVPWRQYPLRKAGFVLSVAGLFLRADPFVKGMDGIHIHRVILCELLRRVTFLLRVQNGTAFYYQPVSIDDRRPCV